MPVTDLPPFPQTRAFGDLWSEIGLALRDMSGRQFIDHCVALRAQWRRLAPHLSADLGYPTKKLAVYERAKVRELSAADIGSEEIAALLRWFDDAILTVRMRLNRAD